MRRNERSHEEAHGGYPSKVFDDPHNYVKYDIGPAKRS